MILEPAEHYAIAERLLAANPITTDPDGVIHDDTVTGVTDGQVVAHLLAAVHYLAAAVSPVVVDYAREFDKSTAAKGPTT